MTTAELATKVQQILAEQLGCDPHEITPEKTWNDLNADSLDQVEIVMAFEEEFDIDIDDEHAEICATAPISETLLRLEAYFAQ